MNPFVNLSDLQSLKYVADSVKNSAVWTQFVQEAQQLDVKNWLGDQLLNEIDEQLNTSPTSLTDANIALLNGGKYVYQTKTYLMQGLKTCIIYYAFARFINRSIYNFSQAGINIKDTDFSTPASDKAIQRLSTEALLTASSLRDEILVFLRRNSTDYPLFKCVNTNGRPRTFHVIGS